MPIIEEITTKTGVLSVIRDSGMLALRNNGVGQSCIFTDDSVIQLIYIKVQDLVRNFSNNAPIKNALVLGGGGCFFPRFLIQYFDNEINIDSVEYDGNVITLCKKYFLDDIPTDKLSLIEMDAFEFIGKTDKFYEVIFVDLFDGDKLTESVYSNSSFLSNLYTHTAEKSITIINTYTSSSSICDRIIEMGTHLFNHCYILKEADALFIVLLKADLTIENINGNN